MFSPPKVSAVDPDPDTTPNGQITYTIVGPVAARALFQIDPVNGEITARVSLTTAAENFYRVSKGIFRKFNGSYLNTIP